MEATKGPSADEGIKKMWSICTLEYDSAMKKNECMPCAATGKDLEILTLGEVNQAKTNTQDITSMCHLKYDTNEPFHRKEDLENRLVVVPGRGRKREGLGAWG